MGHYSSFTTDLRHLYDTCDTPTHREIMKSGRVLIMKATPDNISLLTIEPEIRDGQFDEKEVLDIITKDNFVDLISFTNFVNQYPLS